MATSAMTTPIDLSLWSTDISYLKCTSFARRPEGTRGVHARAAWVPLEKFFLDHGLTLWIVAGLDALLPPDDRERAPDGLTYCHPSAINRPPVPFFPHFTPAICPARTMDGQDVMIRLVSIGADGARHREALERLSTGHTASLIGNHCIPVLKWITLEHICFAVHPLLSFSDMNISCAHENIGDLTGTLRQMLEGLQFCHDRLVAHLDCFDGNWLGNLRTYEAREPPFQPPVAGRYKPLRSLYPYKIFLIDFECAVCFSPDSEPASRLVTGPPLEGYDRPMPPEMEGTEPYDPFAVDIWQVGFCLDSTLAGILRLPPPLKALISRMRAPVAADRPSAKSALAELTALRDSFSREELEMPVHPH